MVLEPVSETTYISNTLIAYSNNFIFFFFLAITLKDGRREEKGTTEDEMIGWHHRCNGHEFE